MRKQRKIKGSKEKPREKYKGEKHKVSENKKKYEGRVGKNDIGLYRLVCHSTTTCIPMKKLQDLSRNTGSLILTQLT